MLRNTYTSTRGPMGFDAFTSEEGQRIPTQDRYACCWIGEMWIESGDGRHLVYKF